MYEKLNMANTPSCSARALVGGAASEAATSLACLTTLATKCQPRNCELITESYHSIKFVVLLCRAEGTEMFLGVVQNTRVPHKKEFRRTPEHVVSSRREGIGAAARLKGALLRLQTHGTFQTAKSWQRGEQSRKNGTNLPCQLVHPFIARGA